MIITAWEAPCARKPSRFADSIAAAEKCEHNFHCTVLLIIINKYLHTVRHPAKPLEGPFFGSCRDVPFFPRDYAYVIASNFVILFQLIFITYHLQRLRPQTGNQLVYGTNRGSHRQLQQCGIAMDLLWGMRCWCYRKNAPRPQRLLRSDPFCEPIQQVRLGVSWSYEKTLKKAICSLLVGLNWDQR